jgi:uncharacterized protein YggE
MYRKIKFQPVVLAALAGCIVLSACAGPTSIASTEQPHTIVVNGSGMAYGKPDTAIVQLGVETRDADPAKAVSVNTDKMSAIISEMKKLGIADKDIQTSNFSVYAQQNYDSSGKPTEYTYVADNMVGITVRDLSKVGDALGKAVAAGANSINGVSFTVSDQTALEAEARDKAMADAKARAEQLAKAAGVTLDKPMQISESFNNPIPYAVNVRAADSAGVAAQNPVPVQAGQIQVNLQVSVTYIIK